MRIKQKKLVEIVTITSHSTLTKHSLDTSFPRILRKYIRLTCIAATVLWFLWIHILHSDIWASHRLPPHRNFLNQLFTQEITQRPQQQQCHLISIATFFSSRKSNILNPFVHHENINNKFQRNLKNRFPTTEKRDSLLLFNNLDFFNENSF